MSVNVIELLQNSVENCLGDTVLFKNFLQSAIEHGSFYSQHNAEAVIKIINNSLNSTFDKEKGLILLQNFLSQISVEAFSNNAVSWMISCNKIISQKEGINHVLALKVLSKLITLSVKFPEVTKEAAKQIVPRFLLDHVRRRSTAQVSVEVLECVQSCMREYPGPSGEFRLDIVKLLLSTVEAQTEVVRAASRCVPLVAGVGGGGKQGVSHKTAWQRQQMALVRLLHTLLNQLYECVDCQVEDKTPPLEDVQLTLEAIDERNILTKSQRLATQFTSAALFLQAMLLEEFPVAKAVAPDAILDVIAHAQKPTLAILGSSREALAITAVLPTVQITGLRLLESLILCLGRNMVPYGGLVAYLCSQIVHWSHQQHSDWPYAMDKPFSQTRRAAYCCLHSWLTVAGTGSQLETMMDKLLPVLLADIHAEKPSVKLKVGSKTGKGRKKQQVLVNQEDRSEKLGDSVANSRLCERALLTLVLLLQTTTPRLKPDMISSLTNTVLQLVADLPVPYSDTNCLTGLYQLLLSLCLEPHARVAPPLATALAAFTRGTHHPAPAVRATCAAALSSLDRVIHPAAATLYFPTVQNRQKLDKDIGEEENDFDDENSLPSAKRMRIESQNETQSPELFDVRKNEEQPSGLVRSVDVKKVDCDNSSDLEEIMELVPIESTIQNVKSGEVITINEEGDDGEIDVVDITEEDEYINSNSQNTEEEKSSQSSGTQGEDDRAEASHGLEENFKSSSSLISKTEEDETEQIKCVITDEEKFCENDEDVSQMLMDFTDEVNEGS